MASIIRSAVKMEQRMSIVVKMAQIILNVRFKLLQQEKRRRQQFLKLLRLQRLQQRPRQQRQKVQGDIDIEDQ